MLIAGGVVIGIVAIVVVVRQEEFGLESLLFLVVGWTFIASGIAGWLRRPENRTGALMIAVGAMWFGGTLLKSLGSSLALSAGIWIGDIWLLPLVFLLAGFPAGAAADADRARRADRPDDRRDPARVRCGCCS